MPLVLSLSVTDRTGVRSIALPCSFAGSVNARLRRRRGRATTATPTMPSCSCRFLCMASGRPRLNGVLPTFYWHGSTDFLNDTRVAVLGDCEGSSIDLRGCRLAVSRTCLVSLVGDMLGLGVRFELASIRVKFRLFLAPLNG